MIKPSHSLAINNGRTRQCNGSLHHATQYCNIHVASLGKINFAVLRNISYLTCYAQPNNLATLAVRKVTRNAVPNVMTTLNVAHL
jgi:hypothetical protein